MYAVFSLCVGIIGVLLVIIIRLVQTRSRIKKQARMDITDPIPSSSPPPPHDDFTSALLNGNHTHPQGDTSGEEAAEIISYNINRPPPFPTDTGTRSFNNYYGWLERESVIMWKHTSLVLQMVGECKGWNMREKILFKVLHT